jgi:hypothetical protein
LYIVSSLKLRRSSGAQASADRLLMLIGKIDLLQYLPANHMPRLK